MIQKNEIHSWNHLNQLKLNFQSKFNKFPELMAFLNWDCKLSFLDIFSYLKILITDYYLDYSIICFIAYRSKIWETTILNYKRRN